MLFGIDPGKNGGIAMNEHFTVVAFPMPETDRDIYDLIQRNIQPLATDTENIVYIERIPKAIAGIPTSRSVMATLHDNAGFIRGVCTALGLRIVLCEPKQWQAHLSLHRKKGSTSREWKQKLRQEAQRRFPAITTVSLEVADALLILEFAMSQTNKNNTPNEINHKR